MRARARIGAKVASPPRRRVEEPKWKAPTLNRGEILSACELGVSIIAARSSGKGEKKIKKTRERRRDEKEKERRSSGGSDQHSLHFIIVIGCNCRPVDNEIELSLIESICRKRACYPTVAVFNLLFYGVLFESMAVVLAGRKNCPARPYVSLNALRAVRGCAGIRTNRAHQIVICVRSRYDNKNALMRICIGPRASQFPGFSCRGQADVTARANTAVVD